LGKNQPGGTSAHKEDFDADFGVKLIEAVNRAGSGLEEGRVLVGEVFDFVELVLFTEATLDFVLNR
jgi:hypothetical protein